MKTDTVLSDLGASSEAPTTLTKNNERWLSGNLWAALRADANRDGSHIWDAPITPKVRGTPRVLVKCGRCDGKGAIASFSVRYSGKCFACGGSGFRLISKAAYDKRRALQKAAEAAS